jgi:hypothetical protein
VAISQASTPCAAERACGVRYGRLSASTPPQCAAGTPRVQRRPHEAVRNAMQVHEPRWVTVPEAAGALGVTPETIRRRLRRGDLRGQHVPDPGNPLGRVWRVALPEARTPTVDAGSPARADALADAQALEIARLHGALADRAREIERLHGIVERLAVPALPSPPADPSADAQALEIARLHGILSDRAREIERLHGIVERLATPALTAPTTRPWWVL